MTLSKAVNFSLQENEISFITDRVKNGRFANRAEVIRARLRLLEDYEYQQKTKRLQMLIAQVDFVKWIE
jgi:putative addiction module CopG family antidote